jgi:hypothetical protein
MPQHILPHESTAQGQCHFVAAVYASASDSCCLLYAVDIANSTTRADLGKELQISSMSEVEKTVLLMFAPEELL